MRSRPKAVRMVVTPHGAWRRPGTWLLALLLLALLAAGMFYLGERSVGFDRLALGGELGQVQARLAALQQERNSLRDKVAALERTGRVDGEAYAGVRDQLRNLQGENLELREEIAFYRGIVAPGEAGTGLGIQSLDFHSAGAPRVYHYKLVLTQVLSRRDAVHGRISVSVNGLLGGKPVSLGLEQISPKHEKSLAFAFKYFQKFEGDVAFPQGFKPQGVQVVVDPAGRGRDKVTRHYDWSALTSG